MVGVTEYKTGRVNSQAKNRGGEPLLVTQDLNIIRRQPLMIIELSLTYKTVSGGTKSILHYRLSGHCTKQEEF